MTTFSPEPQGKSLKGTIKWDNVDSFYGKDDLIPLWVADMDFASPEPIITALKTRADVGIFGYTKPPESYYLAYMEWMKKRHKVSIKKEWIIDSPGIVPAIGMAVDALTNAGEAVIIQTPVYYPFHDIIKILDRDLTYNPLVIENGRYVMDLEALEETIIKTKAKLFILCSPHNPVGRVWEESELKAFCKLVKKYDLIVVSDEIHADLILPGAHHLCLLSEEFDVKDQMILCSAPSKTFNIAGLQASNIVIPNKDIYEAFSMSQKKTFFHFPNCMVPPVVEAAYKEGEEWLDGCLDYLDSNRQFYIDFFTKELPEIAIYPPEGSYLAWADFSSLGLETKALQEFFINEAKVALTSGENFGPEGGQFIRINLASHKDTLKEAFKRIKTAVSKLKD